MTSPVCDRSRSRTARAVRNLSEQCAAKCKQALDRGDIPTAATLLDEAVLTLAVAERMSPQPAVTDSGQRRERLAATSPGTRNEGDECESVPLRAEDTVSRPALSLARSRSNLSFLNQRVADSCGRSYSPDAGDRIVNFIAPSGRSVSSDESADRSLNDDDGGTTDGDSPQSAAESAADIDAVRRELFLGACNQVPLMVHA